MTAEEYMDEIQALMGDVGVLQNGWRLQEHLEALGSIVDRSKKLAHDLTRRCAKVECGEECARSSEGCCKISVWEVQS